MTLTQGQILNNRYRIVKLLGQGGFGAVYKAWDLNFEVVCAIKENFETTPEAQRQFQREARLLRLLRHPNLPQVLDHFIVAGQGQYLVMDFVEGQDLEELRAAAGGRLPEAQVLNWAAQICEALEHLHSQNPPVIHRDLKPANIKITPEGRAMLVDFGIAKTYDPLLRTTLGARAVTPGYSPIEQYGTGVTDGRTDIYSLGATLYTLLTGQEPPEAPQRVLSDRLIPPRQLNPGISPAVEAALLRALQVHPEQRWQSAGELRAVISKQLSVASNQLSVASNQLPLGGLAAQGRAATPVPSPLTPATLVISQPPGARRFPWKWAAIGAGVLAGLALLAGLLSQTPASPPSTLPPTATFTPTPSPIPPSLTPTPSPTQTPSPLPPSPTPTPSPLPPSATPTLGVGSTQISPVDGMVLSYIPGGSFQMGSNDGESDEQPVHSVTLDAFWMDQTEVTNAMYARCVADGVCSAPRESISYTRGSYYGASIYMDYPVIYVDWNQAEAYCVWAGRRLPTEAQWEYAARGGMEGATYPWGDEDPSCTLGAQNGAQYSPCSPDDTIPVASFAPNGYGLFDMAGNVREWVADWYGSYSSAVVENPTGPASGDYRALRGGTWYSNESYLRVSYRDGRGPDDTLDHIGFRCVRSP